MDELMHIEKRMEEIFYERVAVRRDIHANQVIHLETVRRRICPNTGLEKVRR